jgi:flagellar protein FlbD
MIRLTRLNQQVVAVNPDNILWADASPDTVLCFVGGDKLLVRESLDELVSKVVKFQRMLRSGHEAGEIAGSIDREC